MQIKYALFCTAFPTSVQYFQRKIKKESQILKSVTTVIVAFRVNNCDI